MVESFLKAPDADHVQRTLFERAADYVLLLEADSTGRLMIVDASEPALSMHGYERSELVGKPISVIDPFTPAETLEEELHSLESGTPLLFTARHRRKDGSTFEVEVRSTILNFGGRHLVMSVERDISRIQTSEEKLRHMHDLMSYVISHARSAIAVHDRDLKYIYVSERYLKEYNVRERDVIGRHHYDVFPDLPQKWRDVHQRALKGEVLSAEEDPYERADGSIEWTRWECRPWYETDGSIGGIIVYTEVITDRKRAEEEKKALEAQLQQAMKMEAVGRLAGGIAHDFNNLLTGILCNVDLLLTELMPRDPMGDLLRDIASSAERAAALTKQLLAFSRKQVIAPRVLDLNDLVHGLHKMLGRLLGEDITLTTIAGRDLRAVNLDPGQFEQVLVNLAVNARDAMPQGGRIVIETRNVELTADYCNAHAEVLPGDYVLLAVSDTGHGLSEEVKRHLFEPFFTTKGLGRGTGLGLATIFGVVKQAGGSIEVYSEVDLGTTFKIYIPAAKGPAARLDTRPAVAPAGGDETLLLVEDDEHVRRTAAKVLKRLGYNVVVAPDAYDALARLDEAGDKIRLLITDVVMPGMNGRELALQATARRPDLRVLYASGYTENIIVHHGVVDDDVNFIAKPYSPQALASKVRDILDGAR